MNKYIIETIGTFFFVLTIALSGNPLAIGVILTAMVYMGGYISGAHYNPAVTLAIYLRGKIKFGEAVRYMGAQIAGGLIAALVYEVVKGTTFVPTPVDTNMVSVFFVEVLYTFALASVVLHVATSDKVKDNHYYGIAIGLTVMAAAFSAGPISGGVFNPAVAIGPILVDVTNVSSNFRNLLIYISAPLIGGVLAAWMYKITAVHK